MDIKFYWAILWRRKWVVVLTVTIALLVTIIGTLMMVPRYVGSATLRIATTSTGTVIDQRYDTQYTDRLMNTYAKLATSEPVVQELARRLDTQKQMTVDVRRLMTGDIQVEILANTELMKVSVEDDNPVVAAEAANTLAQVLIDDYRANSSSSDTALQALRAQLDNVAKSLDQSRRTYEQLVAKSPTATDQIDAAKSAIDVNQQTYASLSNDYQQAMLSQARQANSISIIEPATPPQSPSSPIRELNLALGLIIGLVGGVGLSFLFENLDTTLFTVEQIEQLTHLTPLGQIPIVKKQSSAAFFNSSSPEEESIRRLSTNLLYYYRSEVVRSLLVTSAQPTEGRSTIVTNLGRALALSGKKVLVVDADLRLPMLHRVLFLSNKKGLTSVLKGESTLDGCVQESNIPGLSILTSGPLPNNPGELLGSVEMKSMVKELGQRYDLVLLDTSPLLPVTDAAILAPVVDGVMFVVACGQSRKTAVQAALQQLTKIKVRALAIVVNRTEMDSSYEYYRYRRAPSQQVA
jgi:succinoglycan biosynthesis transport protein ExoP